ncbi:P-type ATPase [Aphanothece sacrum FPU3]|nr:P-type ATPase [Aphanothece sacrum FPU3]
MFLNVSETVLVTDFEFVSEFIAFALFYLYKLFCYSYNFYFEKLGIIKIIGSTGQVMVNYYK